MYLFSRPTDARIKAFIESLESDSLSYPEVGATLGTPPAGYDIDNNRILLGRGEQDFERAKTAIREWRMFEVPGMTLCYPDTPIEVRRNIAPLARHLGF